MEAFVRHPGRQGGCSRKIMREGEELRKIPRLCRGCFVCIVMMAVVVEKKLWKVKIEGITAGCGQPSIC